LAGDRIMPVAKVFDGTSFKRIKKGMVFRNIEGEGLLSQPVYTDNCDPAMFLTVNERLNTGNYYSSPTYSYSIE